MKIYFPTSTPYNAFLYPKVGAYDLTDPEPENWRLKILLEGSSFNVNAVCSGRLSAVPPWELPAQDLAPLREPEHVLPTSINLYLEPNQVFAPQTDYVTSLEFFSTMEQAGLGKSVRCYVYENIDPAAPGIQIQKQLAGNAFLKKNKITAQRDQWEMFAKGQLAVWVNGGDRLASASTLDPASLGRARVKFGVLTSTGYVDPVAFYEIMQSYLNDSGEFDGFKNLITSDWPFLAPASLMVPPPTALDAIQSAQQRLYPAPALYEAKRRLSLTPGEWRQVANAQKNQYWDRLLRSSGNATSGRPFVFHTEDMGNPFQLEAAAEFYIAWPQPATTGTAPPSTVPNPPSVDLQQGDWNIVLIDPFKHPHLGSPELPKPDYDLTRHTPPDNIRCDPASALSAPFNPDTYNAVLFLVHHGEVKAWYRWTTYSSHKWEGRVKVDEVLKLQCKFGSSATGNKNYYFRSLKGGKAFINYAFMISDTLDEWEVPGRFYFRDNTPEDDGSVAGDSEANKTGVMIHYGASADIKNTSASYNYSGGCFVSPDFYNLRNTMIALYWEDQLTKPAALQDEELSFLSNRNQSKSKQIYNGLKMDDGTRYLQKYWNGKIKGRCLIIHPDEPTQK